MTVENYRAHQTAGEKWCCRCKQWRPITEFNVDRSRFDGLGASCRVHGLTSGKGRGAEKGRPSKMKGQKFSPDAKKNMGRTSGFVSPLKGRVLSLEQRTAISVAVRRVAPQGADCHSYKDGKLSERRGQRFSERYKRWRYDVFTRDQFTCRRCDDNRGGNLHAHHIKGFSEYPDLRFEVNNGETLCETCHKAHHRRL